MKITYLLCEAKHHNRTVLFRRDLDPDTLQIDFKLLAAKDRDSKEWERAQEQDAQKVRIIPQLFDKKKEITKSEAVAIALMARTIP